MPNVIRPDFRRDGARRAVRPAGATPMRFVKHYGEVGRDTVSLVQAPADPLGSVYKVVIATPCGRLDPVGVEPATPDGLFDSDLVGLAVLRTLEILALRSSEPGAA